MEWMNLIAAIVAFVLTGLLGKLVIPFLVKLKFGQSILEIGPNWHKNKQGTPTMGGIMFILGIGLTVLVIGIPLLREGKYQHLVLFGFALLFGLIGLVDDYAKVVKKQNQGLTALQKILFQLAAAVVFLSVLRLLGELTPSLYLPFFDVRLTMPWVVYLVLMMFLIVGAVNAVNLTDGIDGLATSVTIPVAALFVALGVILKKPENGLFAAALAGALVGFWLYNKNPAKVFMGDTGSLFLGGAVIGLAFAFDLPLLFVFVGIIYLIETLSVILQVTYFKLSHGKRIFKMAPIHHHFELCGWGENKICVVFTAITILGCIAAYFGAVL